MTNEKMFSDIKSFSLVFIPINWLICFIVTMILYFILGRQYALGYLLGSMTSFLTFGLLMKSTTNMLETKKKVKTKALTNSFIRMILTAIIVCSTLYTDKFNFITTLIGVLVLKITLLGFVYVRYTFFKDKEEIIDDVTVQRSDDI